MTRPRVPARAPQVPPEPARAPVLLRAMLLLSALSGLSLAAPAVVRYYRSPKLWEGCIDRCRSGFCHRPGNDVFANSYCTHSCEDASDCPAGYSCAAIEGSASDFCRRPPTLRVGQRCSASEECLSGECVLYTYNHPQMGAFQRSYCVERCPASGECPEGTRCQPTYGQVGTSTPPRPPTGGFCDPIGLVERDAQRRYDVLRKYSNPLPIPETVGSVEP